MAPLPDGAAPEASLEFTIWNADTSRVVEVPITRDRFVYEETTFLYYTQYGCPSYAETNYTEWDNNVSPYDESKPESCYQFDPPEAAVSDVGMVEVGDTVRVVLKSQGLTLLPYNQWGQTSWCSLNGRSYRFANFQGDACLDEQYPGALTSIMTIKQVRPELDLIRQTDNESIPREGTNAYVMVSKRPPTSDEGLSGNVVAFDAAGPDEDTFRPQATGVPSGKTVQFRVQVYRNGQLRTDYDHTFSSVPGTRNNQSVYRGDTFLRLVSDSYDDDVRAPQTIRVELEDVIRVTLVLDGVETGEKIELPVGQPAADSGPDAVRRVELNWNTLEGLASAPDIVTARMSETWAQAAVLQKEEREYIPVG